MDRRSVAQWVSGYERAWRDADVAAVEQLFSEDAQYRTSPYEPPMVGHEAIKAFWLDDEDDVFAMSAAIVAVEDADAVVRLVVRYGDPVRQEYTDLWVLHFSPDGRVDRFEEWPYWPGLHPVADSQEASR